LYALCLAILLGLCLAGCTMTSPQPW
jgi:hypothetical protein